MLVLAVGDAFDGITLIGMFINHEEATQYAAIRHRDQEWHVVEVKEAE